MVKALHRSRTHLHPDIKAMMSSNVHFSTRLIDQSDFDNKAACKSTINRETSVTFSVDE